MARIASARPTPICISWSRRANSCASGPSVFLATRRTAASKPSPASTEMVSRSRASGSALRISVSRFCAGVVEQEFGQDVAEGAASRGDEQRRGRRASPRRAVYRKPSAPSDAEAEHLEPDDPVDVPAGGLPAMSRRCWIFSAVSARDEPAARRRRAGRPAGAMTRSANGRSSSGLEDVGRASRWPGRRPPSGRRRGARRSATPMRESASARAPKTSPHRARDQRR